MFRSILWRCARYLWMIWLTITLLFAALTLIRGNPAALYLDSRLSEAHRAKLYRLYGYDQGAFHRYWLYLGNVVRGELGISFIHKQPVARILKSRIGKTLWLGGLAFAMGLPLALFLLWGLHRDRRSRLRGFCDAVYNLFLVTPSFLLAAILIAVLGVKLRLFPIFGSGPLFAEPGSSADALMRLFAYSFLPALSLALPLAGQFTAYLHRQIELLDEAPFIMSARGRGVSEWHIFYNHELRVLLPVIVQMAGLYLPMIAGGALVIEAMFGWSGMGLLLYDAVLARDYPLLLGGTIWVALFVVPGYELADWVREVWAGRGAAS